VSVVFSLVFIFEGYSGVWGPGSSGRVLGVLTLNSNPTVEKKNKKE
jgi:hypothetical protein